MDPLRACKPLSLLSALWLATTPVLGQEYPVLDQEQLAWIGDQIYNNECNRKADCLTAWNTGEEFPSLGIGHFIWYPAGQDGIYEETFPALLAFLRQSGASLPGWLGDTRSGAPWRTRDEFLADLDSARMVQLRTFLLAHQQEQTAFIIQRFDHAVDILTAAASGLGEPDRKRLRENFYRVANAAVPHGMYALIDYVNFKGTGTAAAETYAGQGWGLRQVLLGMSGDQPPLADFIESARQTLSTRVTNAPAERNEQRWLSGWNKRLDTYIPAIIPAMPAGQAAGQ